MNNLSISESEYRLINVIWNNEPLESGKLVKICEKELDWKKSTTYTILRKLVTKQLVKNEDTIVSAIVPRQNIQKYESNEVVKKSFNGSLPAFVNAFLGTQKLSKKDAKDLIKLIEENTIDED